MADIRTPEIVQQEYMNACARLGNIHVTIDKLGEEARSVKETIQSLNQEYNSLVENQKKAQGDKNVDTAAAASAPTPSPESSKL